MPLANAPIDAVITWVDGSDSAHAGRLAHYLAELGGVRPESANPTRFNDAGELDFCVASIFRHAPWVRKIHIVSDQQTPALLAQLANTAYAERIRLVDHREIFAGFEQHLPTFNSRSICAALWRIDGLAEHFLYFNDDLALLQAVTAEDFFLGEQVVLRGRWTRQAQHRLDRRLIGVLRRWLGRGDPSSPRFRVRQIAGQELGARAAGFERIFLRLPHNPHPMRRSTLERYFSAHPDIFQETIRHRLRSAAQFDTESLAAHLELAGGSAVVDNRLRTLQLKPDKQWQARLRRKMQRADGDARFAFACVQSLELAPPGLQAEIIQWLDRRVGNVSALLARAGRP